MRREILIMSMGAVMLSAASLSHEEITVMVEKIKKERSGINTSVLETTPNPFAIIKKPEPKIEKEVKPVIKEVVPEVTYELLAILNHAAFIAGKWYKVGDHLEPYTIHSIGKSSIVLKSGDETKRLFLPKREKKIIFKGK
jgi:hypothetical protein